MYNVTKHICSGVYANNMKCIPVFLVTLLIAVISYEHNYIENISILVM